MSKPSLRDLKKEATAHALAEAAFELALEHGMNGFVVEDIAQRAGYSRRTFANYYSCKEEAVAMVALPFHGFDEGLELVEKMPENITLLDAMYQMMKLQMTADYFRIMRQLTLLAKEYPTLYPYILSTQFKQQEMAQDIITRLFHGRYPEGYSHLFIGALTGAFRPLHDGSLNVLLPGQSQDEAPGAITFDAYLDTIFGYLRNGF
ncbi:TetR/AcrR family transcriptional regulator [Cohnella soli]|uniref:TetR/AcrR family transcriptional regulator n=1 Tax=Cohnella soli TaxID=425005 RepID=A0ABW0I8B0_9BACL